MYTRRHRRKPIANGITTIIKNYLTPNRFGKKKCIAIHPSAFFSLVLLFLIIRLVRNTELNVELAYSENYCFELNLLPTYVLLSLVRTPYLRIRTSASQFISSENPSRFICNRIRLVFWFSPTLHDSSLYRVCVRNCLSDSHRTNLTSGFLSFRRRFCQRSNDDIFSQRIHILSTLFSYRI